MAAQQPARASLELRKAPLSPRYRWNYTTPRGTTRLSGDTGYAGNRFRDLDEEQQDTLMTYVVSVDVIRNATRGEILQMFRRMNAFTLPLNEAEKRHSSFHGEFKWFINNLSDELNEFLPEYQVFTSRQIVRMADAELLTDCVLATERGIVSTSPADLRAVYRNHDEGYEEAIQVAASISEAVRFITVELDVLRGSHMMKPYALHSLITALIHARHSIPRIESQISGSFNARYCVSSEQAAANLIELAEAHEAKELEGPHSSYVWGCLGGTNRAGRRAARIVGILSALGFENVQVIDHELAAQITG